MKSLWLVGDLQTFKLLYEDEEGTDWRWRSGGSLSASSVLPWSIKTTSLTNRMHLGRLVTIDGLDMCPDKLSGAGSQEQVGTWIYPSECLTKVSGLGARNMHSEFVILVGT